VEKGWIRILNQPNNGISELNIRISLVSAIEREKRLNLELETGGVLQKNVDLKLFWGENIRRKERYFSLNSLKNDRFVFLFEWYKT
jgi:hypothetical protein